MIQIVVLAAILVAVPIIIGMLFSYGETRGDRVLFSWISGQMLLWAGFQLISIPFILQSKSFHTVVTCFSVYTGVLLVVSVLVGLFRRKRTPLRFVPEKRIRRKAEWVLWCVFAVLLLFQLVQTGCVAYEEGDDAFYVAVSTITAQSDSMYSILPYTGGSSGLDARHGLAPFPIWIAYLAKMSKMHAATVAQVVLPIVLIVMAYAIYYLLGVRLFSGKREALPLFMVLVSVLILFGGYSLYTAENFLLVRASQGKAVLANLIIPFLFLLLFHMLETLQKDGRIKYSLWILIALTMISGCLCTTLGTVLICALVGIVGIISAVCYRKWKILFPLAAGCLLPMVFAFLYLKLG